MNIKVTGEEVFKARTTSFGVSPSKTGYVLAYSYDNVNWSDWKEPVPANEALTVNGVVPTTFFKLKGNTEELSAII